MFVNHKTSRYHNYCHTGLPRFNPYNFNIISDKLNPSYYTIKIFLLIRYTNIISIVNNVKHF